MGGNFLAGSGRGQFGTVHSGSAEILDLLIYGSEKHAVHFNSIGMRWIWPILLNLEP